MEDHPRHKNTRGDEGRVENDVEHAHTLCRNDAEETATETFCPPAGLYLQ
jgi:hypothetical protein